MRQQNVDVLFFLVWIVADSTICSSAVKIDVFRKHVFKNFNVFVAVLSGFRHVFINVWILHCSEHSVLKVRNTQFPSTRTSVVNKWHCSILTCSVQIDIEVFAWPKASAECEWTLFSPTVPFYGFAAIGNGRSIRLLWRICWKKK